MVITIQLLKMVAMHLTNKTKALTAYIEILSTHKVQQNNPNLN